jgi:hypothetical protein
MSDNSGIVAEVPWIVNPFRGDKFEEHWLPVAEAALDYGATGWALFRSKEGGLDFTQLAFFATKLDFERYWYSEEITAAREEAVNYYGKPVLPVWHSLVGAE